jgi:hypothetical protein
MAIHTSTGILLKNTSQRYLTNDYTTVTDIKQAARLTIEAKSSEGKQAATAEPATFLEWKVKDLMQVMFAGAPNAREALNVVAGVAASEAGAKLMSSAITDIIAFQFRTASGIGASITARGLYSPAGFAALYGKIRQLLLQSNVFSE